MKKLGNSPYLLLIGASLFWGGNAVAGKFLSGSLPPVTISFVRLALSVLVVSPFLIRLFRQNMAAFRKHIKMLVFLSITGVICFNLLLYWALHYTTAINSALLNSTSPLFIFLLSFLLVGDRMAMKDLVSLTISFIGVLFVITQGSVDRLIALDFNRGDLIMVLAVISWALYSIYMKKITGELASFTIFGFTLVIGFLLMIPAAIIELSLVPVKPLAAGEWLSLLYIGVFPSIFSFLMWNRAVALIGPSKSSIFLNLIPVFGAVIAFIWLGEIMTAPQLIGGMLVFSGLFIASFSKKKYIQVIKET